MKHTTTPPDALMESCLDAIIEVRHLLKAGEVPKALMKLTVLESSLHTGLAMRNMSLDEKIDYVDSTEYVHSTDG
ncbi:MAG: hypothetical protein ACRBCI_13450 [Cellvibrionaceae bacterium]